jgi:hypothetical protein
MAEIVQFPARRNTERSRQVRINKDGERPVIGFHGDFYLDGGRNVGFSLSYPHCSLTSRLVAAMLRKAAAEIEAADPQR